MFCTDAHLQIAPTGKGRHKNSHRLNWLQPGNRQGCGPWFRTSWLTEITTVKDGEFFVDEQRKGPYALWHHEHHFAASSGGTLCTDIVTYRIPGGIFGRILHTLFIRQKLMEIFSYREKVLKSLFPDTD